MCEHLRGCSVLERCGPIGPALHLWHCMLEGTKREEEAAGHPNLRTHLDREMEIGDPQSDRGKVIGGKLLIGQLAPWVTWGI